MRVATALLALCLTAAPAALGAAQADPIGEAEAAFEEGRHEDAERLYRAALESGRLAPPGLARVHLRLAELAALGSTGAADRHARFALALDPSLALPETIAIDARPTRAARVVLEISGDDAPIGVRVADAPDGLVRVLEVRGAGFERTLSWDGEAREVDPPAEARPIEVRALDAHGNLVAQAGRAAPPPEPEPGPTPEATASEDTASEDTPAIESPWFWVGVGLVVVGVAVAIALSATGTRYLLDAPGIR